MKLKSRSGSKELQSHLNHVFSPGPPLRFLVAAEQNKQPDNQRIFQHALSFAALQTKTEEKKMSRMKANSFSILSVELLPR